MVQQYLLHGTLQVTLYEAKLRRPGFNLCGKTVAPKDLGRKFIYQLKRLVLCRGEATKLYATVDLDKARVGRTRLIEHAPSNPRWNETFQIYCAHTVSHVVFTVKDANPIGATLIGRAYLPVTDIIGGRAVDRWIRILDEDHEPVQQGDARIHVSLEFLDVVRDRNWSRGIENGFGGEVPRTFFRQREGCRVSLYQDAHVPRGTNLPTLYLSGGETYEPHRCWEDIFDAIINAKHLIYIAGWSVYTKITLIRDHPKPGGGDMNLGELLVKKANEGVRVLMLVWDDRTSVEPLKKDGLMETHDQETADYFRRTRVRCILCPRNPDAGRSIIQSLETANIFTHHQKTVVVDSASPPGGGGGGEGWQKRRILSFVGGIDLCGGRYDTPHHSLFRTLNSVHKDDFHQPNFPGASIAKGGPREPWHDIHCKLEGPVAWDVLYNFEQRWRKQVAADDRFLFTLEELDRIITRPSYAVVTSPEDPTTWNVQIFRSIDGGAASGFPVSLRDTAELGLVTGKDNIIERSIQDAYINAIRRAKNFIYIENQYFLGSSYGWKPEKDVTVEDIGALHLIPKELSLKIVSKIKAGERFSVYVVIPMWPEGPPEGNPVQAILDWQRRTMEMMYKDISNALGGDQSPMPDLRDYLTFFCLGNREMMEPGEYVPPQKPDPDTDYMRAQVHRRFMIYVHAKMMIVDDEYIIVGSANINQRSMDGGRDTEIAMGAYQPHHLASTSQLRTHKARGEIFYFRLSLWHEHLGVTDLFNDPETLQCIRQVNAMADRNWELYSRDTFDEDLPGHLLSYPISISPHGDISTLPGFEFFPDTKAKVLGTKSEILRPILTT